MAFLNSARPGLSALSVAVGLALGCNLEIPSLRVTPPQGRCGATGDPCCAPEAAGGVCAGTLACVSGRCVECSGGRGLCDNVCVDLTTDLHCGACGVACASAAGEHCGSAPGGVIDGGTAPMSCQFPIQCSTPTNLIVNGGFTMGLAGFTSEYHYDDSRNTMTGAGGGIPEGNFTVTANPAGWNIAFAPFGSVRWSDGNGDGFAAIFNGIRQRSAYQTTVSVTAGDDYVIQYRAADWGGKRVASGTRSAIMEMSVDFTPIGPSLRLPGTDGEALSWQTVRVVYHANHTALVTLRITSGEVGDMGNDFALDDVRFEREPPAGCSRDGGVADDGS